MKNFDLIVVFNMSINFNPCFEEYHCLFILLQHQARPAVLPSHSSPIRHNNMGNLINTGACQLSNNSKRNVRVFVTEKALEMDAFIASQSGGNEKISSVLPGGKKFIFRKDVKSVRVLASKTEEVPWVANHFLSVFVEDEDDENICSKKIIHNMALSAPGTVLLYDV